MYLDATEAQGRALWMRGLQGPVTMLNLIRLREVADYSAFPDLGADPPVSGAVAFDRYIVLTLPLLRATGGDLTLLGRGAPLLIGPPEECWDVVMLVRQASIAAFMGFAQDPVYLPVLRHRAAAVADSRLLPFQDVALPFL